MKGLVLLGDGFEIGEMTIPCDYLFRAGIETVKASIMPTLLVESQDHMKVEANCFLKDVHLEEFDFLFIPGGKASYTTLRKKEVDDTILYFYSANKWLFAICAAPSLFGRLGIMKGKKYNCFPGFEKEMIGAEKVDDGLIALDKPFITAKSVFYVEPFALTIIQNLIDETKAKQIYHQVRGE